MPVLHKQEPQPLAVPSWGGHKQGPPSDGGGVWPQAGNSLRIAWNGMQQDEAWGVTLPWLLSLSFPSFFPIPRIPPGRRQQRARSGLRSARSRRSRGFPFSAPFAPLSPRLFLPFLTLSSLLLSSSSLDTAFALICRNFGIAPETNMCVF